ncbi:outer membrane OprD family porin [Azomonas agilis]|uniref:Outer membrane OprD family porin n=1 Tax=Azomonas agilis TaxID=116849 RepID=A0A562IYH9_9GAMM|nr:OprD family porin [Azomonas agilis]TWH75978.1 outer membrane OprD family porin [Azomonas agilis]
MLPKLQPNQVAFSAALIISIYSATLHAEFFNDAKGTLNLRNYYLGRDYDHGGTRGKAEEWTQSFILNLKSGFTEGPIGFGVDILGLWSIKLDGGRGTYGTQLLPVHRGNKPADEFGRLGIAFKARYSNTEFKGGEWNPILPILSSDDGRGLTQTFRGGMLTSKEFKDLTIYAGQMHKTSPRNDASMQRMSIDGISGGHSDRFNFGGAEYSFNEGRTMVSAWFAQLKNLYKQRYFEIRHTQPLAQGVSLSSKLGLFDGEEDGDARAGDLDNKTFFGVFALKMGAHTFTGAYQKLTGKDRWLQVNGTSADPLPNDVYAGPFNNPKEESWQIRHDYDFAAWGIPGLNFMTRYIDGRNVHRDGATNGETWSRENELRYVFQSGALKNLSIRLRNSTKRANWGTNTSWNENRVVINYPISLF